MVEAKFGRRQVPVERLPGHSVEFGQPSFGEAPERFDPVDVIRTPGKFILTVMDPKMFVESRVDRAIIPSPSVGVDETLRIGLAPDHRLENGLARIGDNFRADPIAAFQKPEDDRFFTGPAAPFAPDPVRTESPVKTDVSVAVRSMAKHRTRWRNFASEIFENMK